MFGKDGTAQTDGQPAATDPAAPAEPATDQSFGMISPAPDTTSPPVEPTTAPVPDNTIVPDSGALPSDTTLPPVSEPDVVSPSPTDGSQDDLASIKQQALQQLSPLVGQLDQTPEEKFRTTMMMIQAADNQGLIKAAYDAAQQIGNEKDRAQALLDVINEINYFTQQKDKPA